MIFSPRSSSVVVFSNIRKNNDLFTFIKKNNAIRIKKMKNWLQNRVKFTANVFSTKSIWLFGHNFQNSY